MIIISNIPFFFRIQHGFNLIFFGEFNHYIKVMLTFSLHTCKIGIEFLFLCKFYEIEGWDFLLER